MSITKTIMKSIIDYKEINPELVKRVARMNKRKGETRQGSTELAFEIANAAIQYLDENSFINLTGLKK